MMAIFKKKTKPAAETLSLSLTVLNNPQAEMERKLAMELRTCPTCSYSIINPMNDRCPRCFTMVPLSEHTNCGECSHQGNCTYQGET